MNKQKLKKRQLAAKQKKINRKEQEDNTGVRKRSKKPEIHLDLYYLIKAGLLIAMLISFFTFSTLLLPLFMAYASLVYFSTWAERKINRQFNKENQKKLFKFDSVLSIITIVVSIATSIYSFSTMVGSRVSSFSRYFYRIMSLSTGVRKNGNKSFGTGTPPSDFVKPEGGSMGGSGMGGRPPKPDFDLNDLPIEFAFSQILSSIIQILVFSVIILGVISVIVYVYKNHIRKNRLKIKENNKNDWSFNKDDLVKLLEEEI